MVSTGLRSKRILLGVSGGIAAYKAAFLARLLVKAGAEVQVVMTAGAAAFMTSLSFQALTGRPVRTELLDEDAEQGMGHIELARWPDLIVIAPASADLMARAASGMANDLLTTLLLATDSPVLWVPAMNQAMWSHTLTASNLKTLAAVANYRVMDPDAGEQACGDVGPGRMPEPEAIVDYLQSISIASREPQVSASLKKSLNGTRCVITAGPTREYIDPVRYISNESSGLMGYSLAAAAAASGASVTLVSGPVGSEVRGILPAGVELIQVVSALEMLESSRAACSNGCQVFIAAAAVADYRPVRKADQKLKKFSRSDQVDSAIEKESPSRLALTENPDVLKTLADSGTCDFLVGFAAETEQLEQHARAKLERKNIDLIIANDVSRTDIGFNSEFNEVLLIDRSGSYRSERLPKTELAEQLIEAIAQRLHAKLAANKTDGS